LGGWTESQSEVVSKESEKEVRVDQVRNYSFEEHFCE
jgi:hypothetical protein